MEKEEAGVSVSADDKEVDSMPTIEQVEYERVAYVKGMEEYLKKLNSMPDKEAMEKSRVSLEGAGILQEDGEFTERYRYSRAYTMQKE